MRTLKIIIYILIIISIFLIYYFFKNNRINYIVLGDSLAEGINPYGQIDYSYSDYIADYYRKNNRLKRYINDFTEKDTNFEKIIYQIRTNKNINKLNIKRELRESDLVTISVGQEMINNGEDIDIEQFKELLVEIKKYAKNRIIVIGYYGFFDNKNDNYIKQKNVEIKTICIQQDVTFVDIYNEISRNNRYFPNPNSKNININGQKAIFDRVIKYLK